MSFMSTPRERRHEATRQEILDIAWGHAERDGIAGLSLREIAKTVGLRAPSLYTYFDGKDAIYDAMFEDAYRALSRFNEDVVEAVDGLDRIDALTLAAERFVAFCQESPARYQLMFTRPVPGWEPSAEAYQVSLAAFSEMSEILGRFGVAKAETLDLYTAMTAGLAAQQMANDPGGDRWRRLARRSVEMFVAHLEKDDGGAP
jgi:AcrR family transcriptional regulator